MLYLAGLDMVIQNLDKLHHCYIDSVYQALKKVMSVDKDAIFPKLRINWSSIMPPILPSFLVKEGFKKRVKFGNQTNNLEWEERIIKIITPVNEG